MDEVNPNPIAMSKTAPKFPKPRGTRPGPAWFSREELAGILDVTTTQVDRRFRQLIPADGVKSIDRRLWFRARALIDALVSEAERSTATPESDDPLLSGSVASPALERYRESRADLAAIEVAERRREVVRVDAIAEAMAAGISAFRQQGERLARTYGNGAAELFNEGIADFEAAALKAIASFMPKGAPTA